MLLIECQYVPTILTRLKEKYARGEGENQKNILEVKSKGQCWWHYFGISDMKEIIAYFPKKFLSTACIFHRINNTIDMWTEHE